jgi:hypothetical protein
MHLRADMNWGAEREGHVRDYSARAGRAKALML